MIKVYGLTALNTNALVVYKEGNSLCIIETGKEDDYNVWSDAFDAKESAEIANLLSKGAMLAAVRIIYNVDNANKGFSTSGIQTKEELFSELPISLQPAFDIICELLF